MYKASKEVKSGLKKLQEDVQNNYQKTDITSALSWLSEEVDELKKGISKNDEENVKEELTQVLIWCISIANVYQFRLEEIVESEIKHHIKKYPKKP